MAGEEITANVREFPASSKYTVSSALDYIKDRQVTVNRVSVNVFRSVLPQTDIDKVDVSLYLQQNKVVVNKESLENVTDNADNQIDLVYALTSDAKESKTNRMALSKDNSLYVQPETNESDEAFAARIFSKLFSEAKAGTYSSFYGRDSTIAPNKIKYLETSSSTLHPDHGNTIVTGVNTSMWYIGGTGSTFAFHVEDGDFASMNILLKGEVKVWGIIPEEECTLLGEKMKDHLNEEKKCRIFHKPGLLVDPELLRQWNIHVDYIVQRPGDLVYVGEATMHFVVNNGLNIAEAINYGTKKCLVESERTFCSCDDVGRQSRAELIPTVSENVIVKNSVKKSYKCRNSNCNKSFFYKKNYDEHIFNYHRELSYACPSDGCSKRYKARQSLHEHLKKCKNNRQSSLSERKRCRFPNCSKLVISRHMQRHINEQHLSKDKGTCDRCKKEMLKRNLVAHFAICNGDITCANCLKKFKSKQGRANHKC